MVRDSAPTTGKWLLDLGVGGPVGWQLGGVGRIVEEKKKRDGRMFLKLAGRDTHREKEGSIPPHRLVLVGIGKKTGWGPWGVKGSGSNF